MNESTRSKRTKEKRERSREKETGKRQDEKEEEGASTTSQTITFISHLKTLLEQFVENEIKKKYNKTQFETTFKKQKNKFSYIFTIPDQKIAEEILNKATSSEIFKNKEMDVFLNDKAVEVEVKPDENENFNVQDINNIQSEETQIVNVREIIVENIPEKLTNDKLYEIFFIFGDISKIEFIKKEKKAYITYKYCSSAEKAYKKLNSEKYQSKNLKVNLSDAKRRPNIIGDEEEEGEKEGRVVYLKFNDAEKVPEKEEVKKQLKRFGLVTKLFRKKEGKSYYLEFSSASSAEELIRDYQKGIFKPPQMSSLVDIDYAFNKYLRKEKVEENVADSNEVKQAELSKVEEGKEKEQKTSTSIQKLDPNKHWQVYFDQTYQRNFYFNPFLNQSVWDLPEGAEVTEIQTADYYYDPNITQTKIEQKEEEELPKEREQNYYDDEAWEEDELVEKLVWDKMKEQQLKEWMKRPARQQVSDTRRDTAYVEGNYDYNIWYDKYLTDRKEEKEKIPALHRCNPALDTGFTKADLQEREGGAYFCMFFAKGCCSEGVNCRYYHRVPTKADADQIENLRDVFGRSRFAAHRTDMGGVGTFTKECRSLHISELKMVDTANPIKEMIRIIYENFSEWGEIEDINYIHTKACCFIKYSHRCFAEFAKEAMMGQSLVGEEVLSVKWAYEDPNPMNRKRNEKENENRFLSAYKSKQDNLNHIKQKVGTDLPNVDYYNYYNSRNNPYAYSSGYGNEEDPNMTGYPVTDEVSQMTQNCVKLSETLKMIEENLNAENEK